MKRPRCAVDRTLTVGQRGSAAVHATVLVGVLCVVALLAVAAGGVVVDQRRVESAADLAALAAAAAVQQGRPGCRAAATVAARNGGHVAGCAVGGEQVTVRVVRRTHAVLGRSFEVRSQARAGPVS